MADDFQSQPKCSNCLDTGIETRYKGDPTLETDRHCEYCGAMSKDQYTKRIDDIGKNWGKDDVFAILGLANMKDEFMKLDIAFNTLKHSRDDK